MGLQEILVLNQVELLVEVDKYRIVYGIVYKSVKLKTYNNITIIFSNYYWNYKRIHSLHRVK